jgi:hypothetical protein
MQGQEEIRIPSPGGSKTPPSLPKDPSPPMPGTNIETKPPPSVSKDLKPGKPRGPGDKPGVDVPRTGGSTLEAVGVPSGIQKVRVPCAVETHVYFINKVAIGV